MKKTNRIIFSLRDHRTETYIHVRQLCTTLSCLLIYAMIFCGTALACPPLEDIPREDDVQPAICSAEDTAVPEDIGETAEVECYTGMELLELMEEHSALREIFGRYDLRGCTLEVYRDDLALATFPDRPSLWLQNWATPDVSAYPVLDAVSETMAIAAGEESIGLIGWDALKAPEPIKINARVYTGESLKKWADDHANPYEGIVDQYGRVPLALVLYRLDSALVLFTDGTYRFVELWNTEEIAEPVGTTEKPAVVWNYREIAKPAARA